MELWDINKTVIAVKSAELTEWEKTKYYIALMIFQLLSLAITGMLGNTRIGVVGLISYALAACVGIFGIISCFNINTKNDNKNFIERIVILGLPITVRVSILFWVLFVVISVVGANFEYEDMLLNLYGLFSASAYYLVFFYLLRLNLAKLYT